MIFRKGRNKESKSGGSIRKKPEDEVDSKEFLVANSPINDQEGEHGWDRDCGNFNQVLRNEIDEWWVHLVGLFAEEDVSLELEAKDTSEKLRHEKTNKKEEVATG